MHASETINQNATLGNWPQFEMRMRVKVKVVKIYVTAMKSLNKAERIPKFLKLTAKSESHSRKEVNNTKKNKNLSQVFLMTMTLPIRSIQFLMLETRPIIFMLEK